MQPGTQLLELDAIGLTTDTTLVIPFHATTPGSTRTVKQFIFKFLESPVCLFSFLVGKPAYSPRSYHDYRTIRLDEKVDAKGYRYVWVATLQWRSNISSYSVSLFSYETVGGILAEEVGTFQNIGLKTEGVRAQGYVQITDNDGISYRIDYQTEGRNAYVPPARGEAPRTPPSIVKLLSLMELHK